MNSAAKVLPVILESDSDPLHFGNSDFIDDDDYIAVSNENSETKSLV